jgi:hypothetical protein
MTAPDRIWTRDVDGTGSQHPCWPGDEGAVAWVRRDPAALAADETVLAMIGAVVEEAAGELDMGAHVMSHHGTLADQETYQHAAKLIRAIRPDATAALSRALQQARNDALEEAAKVVDGHYAKGDMGNPGHWVRALKDAQP